MFLFWLNFMNQDWHIILFTSQCWEEEKVMEQQDGSVLIGTKYIGQ